MSLIHVLTCRIRSLSRPRTRKFLLHRLSLHPSIRAMDLIPRFNLALASVVLLDSVLHLKGNAETPFYWVVIFVWLILVDCSHTGPSGHVQIMSNPNRARGGHYVNGRGGHPTNVIVARGRGGGGGGSVSGSQTHVNGAGRSSQTPISPTSSSQVNGHGNASSHVTSDSAAETMTPFRGRGRGFMTRGRGSFPNSYRGGSRGSMRGRGRGSFTPILS